ncbi:MAG: thiolase domain-containing protein [Myxococcota bacterium]
MRDVAIASFAQTKYVRNQDRLTEVDMLLPVVQQAIEGSGIPKQEIGFTCHGSSDYLAGQSFAFVGAVDALGAWPPIAESHVEMDGAWALYEAWVKIQCGECDSALVFGVGRASMGKLPETLNLQFDPYTVAPLGLDSISSAALQARAMIDAGKISEEQMAEIAVRNRAAAKENPNAQLAGDFEVEKLLAEPYLVSPLRKHDCPPISDGVSAIVIVAGDAIGKGKSKPVYIRGIDHRLDSHQLGGRDLTVSLSTKLAGDKSGVHDGPVQFAELHAPFSHQEVILQEALDLGNDVQINPSGGALAANPMMTAGLTRIGEAASRIASGKAGRGIAHATSGPCLQQNLVCVLEAA